jgi:hypothetical protein
MWRKEECGRRKVEEERRRRKMEYYPSVHLPRG